MPTGTISVSAAIAGSSFINSVSKTADSQESYEVSLPPGTVEESYSQTSTVICVVTLAAGHGLATGVYDAYWTESGVDKKAIGCTGTLAGDDMTLSAAVSQDNFPAADPGDMVICEQVVINTTIDGDQVQMFAISPVFSDTTETEDCSVDFHDVSSNQITTLRIPANEMSMWWDGGGLANPMTGAPITHCHASNQSVTNTATLKILVLEDSTP
ncbi:hypothetical protein LCGC14_2600520 [marine sediment metagenome]|uniref:Uncharacterized protein n=1 Tax=marine sediment metagenome TaxID=412755 RepID=A0A0F9AWK5_9ZZZZ|nr:hypothetical protein [Phycisphaerae bacterium]